MKVCIIGCGAIGSLFAAPLAKLDDVEVWAYDPYQDHVDAINEHGLKIIGGGDCVGPVKATSDASELPQCDFGIIAAKTMHTRPAMEAVARAFKDGGAVCSVQNGVGAEEIIAEFVPHVIMGTTFPAGHITEPGVCHQDTGGSTWIGPFDGKPASMEQVEQLADACQRAGLDVKAMDDARGALWTKLIFNSASNAMGALTRLPHGIACDQPGVRAVMSALAQEGIAVSKALGVTLDSDPEKLIDYGREVAYNHKPSMLQDVEAERLTEVDALNAGIAKIGREVGVPCPLNEAVAGMIKGLEHSWTLES